MYKEVVRRPEGVYLEQVRPLPTKLWILIDDQLTIGRDPSSDVFIDDPGISRHHADLIPHGTGWSIVDTASTNGTYVNGTRIREISLQVGDRIGVGEVELILRKPNVSTSPQEVTLDASNRRASRKGRSWLSIVADTLGIVTALLFFWELGSRAEIIPGDSPIERVQEVMSDSPIGTVERPTLSPSSPTEPAFEAIECSPPGASILPRVEIRSGGSVEWRNGSETEILELDFSEPEPPDFHPVTVLPGQGFRRAFVEPAEYQYTCVFPSVKQSGTVAIEAP